MRTQLDLELKVREASAGSKEALDIVLNEFKDMIYNLSLKMELPHNMHQMWIPMYHG